MPANTCCASWLRAPARSAMAVCVGLPLTMNAPLTAAATFAADLIQRQVAFEQLCDPLAGIEHAGLHRILLRVDDLCAFGDRLFVIVEEVDDLAVCRRQLGQGLPPH